MNYNNYYLSELYFFCNQYYKYYYYNYYFLHILLVDIHYHILHNWDHIGNFHYHILFLLLLYYFRWYILFGELGILLSLFFRRFLNNHVEFQLFLIFFWNALLLRGFLLLNYMIHEIFEYVLQSLFYSGNYFVYDVSGVAACLGNQFCFQ